VAATASAPAAAAAADSRLDFSGKNVAELRDAITRGVIRPLNLVMLTRDRIEEVVNDAVERGRMTAEDAQTIVQGLVQRGREQTDSVMSDLEGLLARGREAPVTAVSAVGRARKQVSDTAKGAGKRARDSADPVIAQADRARRVAGVGPSFPILGYDDLTAAQVQSRLDGLSPAELRKVRDYEKRNANRKSVLDSVEKKLG
jgi:polyhydroxyalkanoate synthesis regulator phasin